MSILNGTPFPLLTAPGKTRISEVKVLGNAGPGATVSSLTRNMDGSIRARNGYTEVPGASGEREIRFALELFFRGTRAKRSAA